MMLFGYTQEHIEWTYSVTEVEFYVGVGLRWHPVARSQ
jgi:hypothetical protein